MSEEKGAKPNKMPDLSFRLGYRKQELPYVIPYSVRQIEELISKGQFPRGFKVNGCSHLRWSRQQILDWWQQQARNEAA